MTQRGPALISQGEAFRLRLTRAQNEALRSAVEVYGISRNALVRKFTSDGLANMGLLPTDDESPLTHTTRKMKETAS